MAKNDAVVRHSAKARFEDVRDDLKLAIAGKGLVVDYESFINRMLERTGKDVGSSRKLYRDAQAFVFCSAALSRRTMEADPANIAFCPYSIIVYETVQEPGRIHVTYQRSLPEVDALLDDIAREALGLR
ncbi:MAG TPA: DUF302 domain-containing protein [Burkholderiales bacterium]|nr:DUF302 domain-containing protein [Burkholderiales bacterium]